MTLPNAPRGRVPYGVVRRFVRSDDSGATLIFALIFITAVAVMIAAVLSFVDTGMRTTVVVRSEAAKAATADGAAQIAVNSLRNSTYAFGGGGSCQDVMPGLSSQFTQGGTTYSATVNCATDTPDSQQGGSGGGPPITSQNRPGQAILTLGSGTKGGLEVYPSGNLVMKVKGQIYSDSYIEVQKYLTDVNADIDAVGTCTALSGGAITSTGGSIRCNLGAGARRDDPDYSAPSDNLTVQAVPRCTGKGPKLFKFSPGIYTDLVSLNALTSSSSKCAGSILWFPPGPTGGSYYFDLSGTWQISSGYVVGGTPNGTLNVASPPNGPNQCETPIAPDGAPAGSWSPPPPDSGIEFVLGGTSRISLGDAFMELCGSYSTDHPPIALYGTKNDITGNGNTVHAEPQMLCPTTEMSGLTGNGGTCATLYSDNSPRSQLYIEGTTYLPYDWVDVNINNASGQVFRFGIISRKLTLFSTGSANMSNPVIEVPDLVFTGPIRTVLYLKVFVCTGTTSCSTSGTPQLQVKVGIGDPDGTVHPGNRPVTVYDWSAPS
jgi:hypothetical protein